MKKFAASMACLAIALSGCSTVRSTLASDFSTKEGTPEGLTYFLPVRFVQFTATREPTTLNDLLTKRDGKVAALAGARATLLAARTRREQAQGILNGLPATSDLRPIQARIVELAVAEETAATPIVATLETQLAEATSAVNSAHASGVLCTFSASLELLATEGDRSARFVAQPFHNILRDDTTRVTVNAAGLLASANVVAVDQTVQALVEIASAAAGVPASGIDARDETTKELLKPSCNGPKRFVAVLDPTVGTDLSDVNDALQKAGYPFKIDEPDMRGAPVTDGGASNLPSDSTWVSGLYYRNPVAVTLTIQQTQDYASWQPIHSTVMQLPQAGPIGFIPMRANALVRTTHDTVFANGSAVDMSSVRPSEVLSAARAPMLILDGVLTSVSRVAQARLNIGNTDVSLEGQQNTLAAAQLKNQIFRECVADAAIRGVSAAPCLVESD